jgi:hypothetical protein
LFLFTTLLPENTWACQYPWKKLKQELRTTDIVKQADFQRHCVGDEWINSGRPITRVEFRLGRDALKCFGVNTVKDLQERERAIFDLLTMDWLRILKDPKVRGHENTAELHPIWERVRTLFMTYFSGAEVESVEWQRKDKTSCDPVALKKQALGCLSKAFAAQYGKQNSCQLSVAHANDWIDQVQRELHEKWNRCAEYIVIKTGFELGVTSCSTSGYDDQDLADLRYDLAEQGREKFNQMFNEQGVLR